MTFNPDDFVFTDIPVPEENPTLIEYDAVQKFILVRTVNPDIDELKYKSCQLSEQLNTNLLENLPDEFSNRNDRIVLFYIRKDGSYRLEKEKLKYSFATKTSTWIKYTYEDLSLEQAQTLFEAIKAAVWTQEVVSEVQVRDQMLELVKKRPYLDKMHTEKLATRDKQLRACDFRVLPDYVEEYEGEKDNWLLFRDTMRNIIKSPDMFDTDLDYLVYNADFRWPISPIGYNILDPEHETPYLEGDNHWSVSISDDINEQKLEDINSDINNIVKSAINGEIPEGFGGKPDYQRMVALVNRYKLMESLDVESLNLQSEG